MHDTIFGNKGTTTSSSALLSSLPVPAETVFAGDSFCPTGKNTCFQVIDSTPTLDADPPYFGYKDAAGLSQGQFVARHLGGMNVVFLDGHAKWYRMEAMLTRSNNGTNRLKFFTARED